MAATLPGLTASATAQLTFFAEAAGALPTLGATAILDAAPAAVGAASLPSLGANASAIGYTPSASLALDAPARYTCVLTGAADDLQDLAISISSIQGRYRENGSGYGRVVVPAALGYVDEIAARPNGEIVVTFTQGDLSEEMLRFEPKYIRLDRGAESQSMTLSGAFDVSARAEKLHDLQDVTYLPTTDGVPRYRAAARGDIRPGDTVRYAGASHIVTEVVWQAADEMTQMEVEC